MLRELVTQFKKRNRKKFGLVWFGFAYGFECEVESCKLCEKLSVTDLNPNANPSFLVWHLGHFHQLILTKKRSWYACREKYEEADAFSHSYAFFFPTHFYTAESFVFFSFSTWALWLLTLTQILKTLHQETTCISHLRTVQKERGSQYCAGVL